MPTASVISVILSIDRPQRQASCHSVVGPEPEVRIRCADQIRDRAAAMRHFGRLHRLVRAVAGLAPQVLVSVADIPCQDPACEGPATQVTILGMDLMRRVMVVHRPAAEASAADIAAAL